MADTRSDKDYAKLVEQSVTTTDEQLGEGAFAEVFQVKYCGTKYAAKNALCSPVTLFWDRTVAVS